MDNYRKFGGSNYPGFISAFKQIWSRILPHASCVPDSDGPSEKFKDAPSCSAQSGCSELGLPAGGPSFRCPPARISPGMVGWGARTWEVTPHISRWDFPHQQGRLTRSLREQCT